MFKKVTKIVTIFLFVFSCLISCSDRPRNNPLDPKSKIQPDVTLKSLSFNDRIELNWNKTKITDFKGYNIYKQDKIDSSFYIIARELHGNPNIFMDYYISYNATYSYYLTIQGENNESLPSNIVTTTPGPGYNWIVDKYGHQILKITYDAKYQMDYYFTDWMPEDIAIDKENNIVLITQPTGKRIDIINTQTADLEVSYTNQDRYFINNPYLTEFEPKNNMFWITDSGGTVYRISSSNYSINLVQSNIVKPGEISIQHTDNIVNIIDENSSNIYQFDLNGNNINILSHIGSYILQSPKKFIIDSIDNQFWLVEEKRDKDYLYTGFINNSQISFVDSFEYVFEIHLSPIDQLPWIAVYDDGKSTIMQLSKAGNRQLELSGFYFPHYVTHNPYDGTLLVADSENRRVIHYKEDFEILGIFTKLNFPIRLEVE